eukprot:TRINITY_DN2366_c0_g1_i1.p1 TRINITY_DN2366_c0_g1~~TRINITY_DN2366_c0_g1_i1.p1  ORF type:complete len:190 (-),score=36.07 TRINITY_DN2366_c0_g1_i1:108-677(-)
MGESVVNIVMLGDGGVGKSALTVQFTQNHFIQNYDPTIENTFRKNCDIDGKTVLLNILDTAGQEEFISLRGSYIRTGEGFIVMYSIISEQSFKAIHDIQQEIMMVKDDDTTPWVLVGNKCDLEEKRVITKEQGQELATKHNCPFLESSALSRINVDETFNEIVRKVLERRGPEEENRKESSSRRRCIVM